MTSVTEQQHDQAAPDWLFDQEEPDGPEPIYLDRSTLERYANCPAQGSAVERELCITASPEADAGTEVHDVIAYAMKLAAEGDASAADVRYTMEDALLHCRPDVQPQAIEGLRRSTYSIVNHLFYHRNGEPRHWDDIIRFDGGEGDRSGQLAWDISQHEGRPVRPTCEVDLLMASNSDEELDAFDFKSGRTMWSATDVAESFQFGTFYSWMIFANHPTCRRLHYRVWNTRLNYWTGRVTFTRERHFNAMQGRLESAVSTYLEHRMSETAPAWPSLEKCALCPAAVLCPEAKSPVREVAKDPEAAARQLIALEASAAKLKTALTKYADAHGRIQVDNQWFGRDTDAKPPTKKPAAKWHTEKQEPGEDSE